MKRIHILFFTMLSMVVLMAGCGTNNDDSANNNSQNSDASTEQTDENNASDDKEADETTFPFEYTDASDEEITVEEKPETVVSTLPSNTEIAFALGLDEEVIGVTENDNYPEAVEKKDTVGGLELNIEKIIELDPDLVLAGELNQSEGIEQLRNSGVKVVVIQDASNFPEVYETIETMGGATGTAEEANTIVSDMKDHLDNLKEKAESIEDDEHKRVLMEISPSPEIYVAGSGTFMDQLLEIINADNVAGDEEGSPMLDQEKLIEFEPEVVVTTYGSIMDDPVAEVANRGGWENVPAILNKAIYDVNTDLVSRPGPRLVDGAEALGKVIYPDVFKE